MVSCWKVLYKSASMHGSFPFILRRGRSEPLSIWALSPGSMAGLLPCLMASQRRSCSTTGICAASRTPCHRMSHSPQRCSLMLPQLPPRTKFLKASEGDPSKQPSDPATQPSGIPHTDTPSSVGKAFSPPSYQATAHPPSPPPSKPGSEERISQPFRKEVNESPGVIQPLVGDTRDQEEHGRGRVRSRVKKRCIATEESGEHGMKRQRLE